MARLFFSVFSILCRTCRSARRMCSPAAISSVEAGSRLTCRNLRMLSELRCEGRGIGGLFGGYELLVNSILLNFFRWERNFFRSPGVSYAGQHTTGWPPSVRLAGFPGNGKTKGGGKTWPASLLFL